MEVERLLAVLEPVQRDFPIEEWGVALLDWYGGTCFHVSLCEISIATTRERTYIMLDRIALLDK
jgi:hypothetical protein